MLVRNSARLIEIDYQQNSDLYLSCTSEIFCPKFRSSLFPASSMLFLPYNIQLVIHDDLIFQRKDRQTIKLKANVKYTRNCWWASGISYHCIKMISPFSQTWQGQSWFNPNWLSNWVSISHYLPSLLYCFNISIRSFSPTIRRFWLIENQEDVSKFENYSPNSEKEDKSEGSSPKENSQSGQLLIEANIQHKLARWLVSVCTMSPWLFSNDFSSFLWSTVWLVL